MDFVVSIDKLKGTPKSKSMRGLNERKRDCLAAIQVLRYIAQYTVWGCTGDGGAAWQWLQDRSVEKNEDSAENIPVASTLSRRM